MHVYKVLRQFGGKKSLATSKLRQEDNIKINPTEGSGFDSRGSG
jgi:hypothetical protein